MSLIIDGLYLSQGFVHELTGFTDPVEAYETLTHWVQTAEQSGNVIADPAILDHKSAVLKEHNEITASAVVPEARTKFAAGVGTDWAMYAR